MIMLKDVVYAVFDQHTQGIWISGGASTTIGVEVMLTATHRSQLALGSIGNDVTALQSKLNDFYGPSLRTDGCFGSETEALVKQFQQNCAIAIDGVVGPQTWSALVSITPYAQIVHTYVRQGETSDEVKYLQARLNYYFGAELSVDGCFDEATTAQVKRFQSAVQITVDGIVGPQTWLYLDPPNINLQLP